MINIIRVSMTIYKHQQNVYIYIYDKLASWKENENDYNRCPKKLMHTPNPTLTLTFEFASEVVAWGMV